MVINYYDFRTVQSNTIAKNATKAVQPLTKPDSLLEEIDLSSDHNIKIDITKEAAPYIEENDNFQTLPSVKYKGIISKIDTKARSGYIDSGSKRLPFTYPKTLKHEQCAILVESLKRKIQVYLIGAVTMDFESNPKSMVVGNIESDIKLL
jgi:hypothetical protein